MSTNDILRNVNKLINERRSIIKAFTDRTSLSVLYFLSIHDVVKRSDIAIKLGLPDVEVDNILEDFEINGLIIRTGATENDLTLSPSAKKRISYGAFSFDFLIGKTITGDNTLPHPLGNIYKIENQIGKGATSYTFCAKQSGTHKDRTLKVFLPVGMSTEF